MRQESIKIKELDPSLKEHIGKMLTADELIITEIDRPIAKIVPIDRPKPVFGSCAGMLEILFEDDDHLADFPASKNQVPFRLTS
jgi:antitoxin (DNA-binding transcriptional repressor) of toxin-antitoxin stability system